MGASREVPPYSRLAEVYDEVVVDPCYGRWAGHLDRVWRADRRPVRRVLDVCCGTGLMAAELTARGYEVVGVDASEQMLARAGRRLGDGVRLLHRQLPDLGEHGELDAAVSTFDSLNYLSPAYLRATMVAVARLLRPGGWFVFDLHTAALVDFTLANPVVRGEAEGYRFTITTVVDLSDLSCDTWIDLTRVADGYGFVEHHRQWFHPDELVREALARAGLTLLRVAEEYGEDPVGPGTLRATWTARLDGPVAVPAEVTSQG